MKKILITGANSYIGTNFKRYALENYPGDFVIDTLEMKDSSWREKSFSGYDCVFHVAGIAHVDISGGGEEIYYRVNRDLAIETAQKAKHDGVKQFVFMSSMIIYGDSHERITPATLPAPENAYGKSKLQADESIRALADESFIVTVLRPPMIYGQGSKGNYPALAKLARRLLFFPDIKNERSMLFICNLCEFLCQVIKRRRGGIFFPQNAEYTCTSEMVREIARLSGHRIFISRIFNFIVRLAGFIPGRVRKLSQKAFSTMTYEQSMSVYDFEYRLYSLNESLRITEGD